MRWFTWLTPPAPAAIAVLRLSLAEGPVRQWPAVGRAGFAHLRDPAGAVVDQAVILRLDPEQAELCVHGGPGMRAAVGACLAELILDGQAATVDISGYDLARFAEGRLLTGEHPYGNLWR